MERRLAVRRPAPSGRDVPVADRLLAARADAGVACVDLAPLAKSAALLPEACTFAPAMVAMDLRQRLAMWQKAALPPARRHGCAFVASNQIQRSRYYRPAPDSRQRGLLRLRSLERNRYRTL